MSRNKILEYIIPFDCTSLEDCHCDFCGFFPILSQKKAQNLFFLMFFVPKIVKTNEKTVFPGQNSNKIGQNLIFSQSGTH